MLLSSKCFQLFKRCLEASVTFFLFVLKSAHPKLLYNVDIALALFFFYDFTTLIRVCPAVSRCHQLTQTSWGFPMKFSQLCAATSRSGRSDTQEAFLKLGTGPISKTQSIFLPLAKPFGETFKS
jgi:hypothetical protein